MLCQPVMSVLVTVKCKCPWYCIPPYSSYWDENVFRLEFQAFKVVKKAWMKQSFQILEPEKLPGVGYLAKNMRIVMTKSWSIASNICQRPFILAWTTWPDEKVLRVHWNYARFVIENCTTWEGPSLRFLYSGIFAIKSVILDHNEGRHSMTRSWSLEGTG